MPTKPARGGKRGGADLQAMPPYMDRDIQSKMEGEKKVVITLILIRRGVCLAIYNSKPVSDGR